MGAFPGNTASGNISPCRFLKLTGDFRMGQCVAGEVADAVSREFVRDVPQSGSSPLAAALGEPVQVASMGEMCEIEVGAAVVAGTWVKPDANGRAVPAVSTNTASGRVYRGQTVVGNRALIVVRNLYIA